MAGKMTLEAFETQLSVFRKQDIQKKMDIASNVGTQCGIKHGLKFYKDADPLFKCQELTGVPKDTLVEVKSLENKSLNFEKWLKEQKQMIQRYSYEYTRLRKILVKHYTQLLKIPTGINDDNKNYEGYKTFFDLVPLPGTKASIIIEKPETLMERHRFLHTKMMYREQKKNIVYIGKINLILHHGKYTYKEDDIDGKHKFIIAASETIGHIGYIYSCGTKLDYLSNWIDEKIIPQLHDECVIIFQENVLDNEKPIPSDVSKEQIIRWLVKNKVPHDPTMHRAELYKLLKTFQRTQTDELSPAELSFRAKGHITIRKKKCNLYNNYFDPFWDFLLHELNTVQAPVMKISSNPIVVINKANLIVQNVPLEYWNNLGNILLEKESNIYKEDLEMEYIIDKLMTMVKNEGLPQEWDNLDEYKRTADHDFMFLYYKQSNLYRNMQKKDFHKSLNTF